MRNEEVEKVMQMPGEVRGAVFQTDARYVLEKKGEGGLSKVVQQTKDWGYPIDYLKMKSLNWYPAGLRVVSLLAIKESFNWGEKEIFDMGNSAPKFSIIVKMLLKYFVSLQKSVSQIPVYWRKHWTVGHVDSPEFSEEKRRLFIRIRGIDIHSIFHVYEAGYFLRIAQYVIKGKKVKIEDKQCLYKGEICHGFLITWQ